MISSYINSYPYPRLPELGFESLCELLMGQFMKLCILRNGRCCQGTMSAKFLRHEGFLGAVGAFLKVHPMTPPSQPRKVCGTQDADDLTIGV